MTVIPHIFHQFWTGPPMPDAYRRFAEGWQEKHPGWEVILWGEEHELPALRNQELYDRAKELCPNHVGQLRSDIVRLELLELFGGVWIDVDFRCQKCIEPLLDSVQCFVAWVTDEWLNNAIMGSVPGHPFIGRLIDGMAKSIAERPGQPPRRVSGPQYLTRVWRRQPDATVKLFDRGLFYPYRWDELDREGEDFPDAYAVHVWNNQRREHGRTL